jgi:hypothetical protein
MLSVVNLSSGCQSNVEDRRSSFKALVRALWATATCSVVVPTVAPLPNRCVQQSQGIADVRNGPWNIFSGQEEWGHRRVLPVNS